MLTAICLFVAFLLYFLYYELYSKRKDLPPGPLPLPLLGNMLSMDFGNPHETIFKWGQKYGPVITVWFGPRPFVFFTDFPSMKQYFLGKTADALSFRSFNYSFEFFFDGKNGIVFSDGQVWREHRRFALRVLRDFGFGRNLMETKINQQVHELQDHLDDLINSSGQVLDLSHPLELCIANVISAVVFGRTFQKDDAGFTKLKLILDEVTSLLGRPDVQLLGQMPWLQYVPLFRHFGMDELKALKGPFWEYMDDTVKKTMEEFDSAKEQQDDLVSAYLKEMQGREELGTFTFKQLTSVVTDIWSAGQETTVTTMQWAILYLLHYPDIQDKIHQEIDRHFQPGDGDFSMADRQRLPYTAAAVLEIQRLGNIIPINLPHTSDRDLQVNSWVIPKGTVMVPNISALFLDPERFPDPLRFDPLRFLDKEGNLKKVEEFIPFSLGKRSCLGESLARMELFLVFVGLMRSFKVSPVPGEPLPSLEAKRSFLRKANPFKVWIQKRNR